MIARKEMKYITVTSGTQNTLIKIFGDFFYLSDK